MWTCARAPSLTTPVVAVSQEHTVLVGLLLLKNVTGVHTVVTMSSLIPQVNTHSTLLQYLKTFFVVKVYRTSW